ncbi:enoyl-CoA hydratase/isomerase family protein [Burkholderia sp. BCC1993]|uniref:enoyl-CoA hydratase/isomerase family protein n=1 Tax=Burkholderia sp. BCC1993 TaxID=2817444 RepID=UPI002AB27A76|nr:enoyl-CoA hydratase/isomerase family protein [Burkholderia sp. BCC1993]
MKYGTVVIERAGSAALLRLNRPGRLNAYTPEMGEDLVAAFRQTAADDTVRAVILTGSGRAFCAGADRDCFNGNRGASGLLLGEEIFVRDFACELAAHPKLTIAAFNGPAVGIGVTMTLAMDLRIAATDALLKVNFAELGILPGLGASHMLPHLLGLARAKQLLLCDREISAQEALQIGLVERIAPADELMECAQQWVERFAACPPDATAAIKQLLQSGVGQSFDEAVRNEQAQAAVLNQRSRG